MGNNLKLVRVTNGLSQAQVSKIAGVTQGTLSNWERGEYDIDTASLAKLADYFNCTIDYLLGRTDAPNVTTNPQEVLDSLIANQKSSPWGSGDGDFERIRLAYAKATPEQRAEFAKIFERYVEGEE